MSTSLVEGAERDLESGNSIFWQSFLWLSEGTCWWVCLAMRQQHPAFPVKTIPECSLSNKAILFCCIFPGAVWENWAISELFTLGNAANSPNIILTLLKVMSGITFQFHRYKPVIKNNMGLVFLYHISDNHLQVLSSAKAHQECGSKSWWCS